MDVDESVNQLLHKTLAINEEALMDWYECFAIDDSIELRLKVKTEITNSFQDTQLQMHPERNFLVKLISGQPHGYKDRNGSFARRFELFAAFVAVMSKSPYWREFLATTLRATVPLADFDGDFDGDRSIPSSRASFEELTGNNNVRKSEKSGHAEDVEARIPKIELSTETPSEDGGASTTKHRHERTPINYDGDFDSEKPTSSMQASFEDLLGNNKLNNAAKLEQVEDVKKLTEDGAALITRNEIDCTPLHYAAMAIQPKAEIARRLVEVLKSKGDITLINQHSDSSWGRNTALHIAAANVNVTQAFIDELKDAKPRVRNSQKDTPFHVAAKSDNPNAIIYLLNTFAPTNAGWDIDVVDVGVDPKSTLINLCARKGNAKAVALLIQHGADISKGVLHEIVLESVRRPHKIEKFIKVYDVIIENAVTWRCLEEKYEVLPFKGYEDYTKIFRRTAVWLLTNPLEDYQHTDVLQCAIAHGAERMLWHMINTKCVLRTNNENNITSYDVSNFTEETLLKETSLQPTLRQIDNDASTDSDSDESRRSFASSFAAKKTRFLFWKRRQKLRRKRPIRRLAERTSEWVSSTGQELRSNCSSPSKISHYQAEERNFDELHVPAMPYLTYLLTYFDQWKCSDVLSWQPFNSLTKPYFTFVQRFYLFLGLLQLVYTILFSWYYMPDACSLSMMFGVWNSYCSGSGNRSLDQIDVNESEKLTTNVVSQNRSRPSYLWLIWPAVLILYSILAFYYSIKHEFLGAMQRERKSLLTSQDLRMSASLPLKFCQALLQSLPMKLFCFTVPVWFYKYRHTDSHSSYAEVAAVVLLFAWLTNLHFFGTVNKNFNISAMVVKEIVMKDLGSFMMFFGFTVIGFSFAMHALRLSACENESFHIDETFYSVLSSAFGIGDFFEETITNPSCSSMGTRHLFQAVYFGYVCTTMIILLNVLIAMMNQRYEIAKCRVENLWRFHILSTMRGLESHKRLAKIMRNYKIFSPWRYQDRSTRSIACKFGCCFHDENRSHLSFKHNRYYLRLVLPIDEK